MPAYGYSSEDLHRFEESGVDPHAKQVVVLAGQLADEPDQVAPVSGCRCRSCGLNAHNRQGWERWLVVNGAAYCPECLPVPSADGP